MNKNKPQQPIFTHVNQAIFDAILEKDADTAHHCSRVGYLAEALGRTLQLPDEDLPALREAGFIHDSGKIEIPDAILLKPGKLEADQFAIIQTHSVLGERIVAAHAAERGVHPSILSAVRHHHEHYDGSGYPDGLAGDRIPLWARIIGVVDCYDALTATRPYHRPRSHELTMACLKKEAGIHLDPEIFDVFEKMMGQRLGQASATAPGA